MSDGKGLEMKISVCMATYNGEKFIKEQLASILHQLDETDEVIISDDSSTDETVNIIESFDDARVRIYKDQVFKSPIFNFENALKKSSGDYIFLADQDDIWMPGKVEIIKTFLVDYDLVLSDANIIDAEGNIINDSFYLFNNSKNGLINNIIKNSYLGCTMAFNKRLLERALPFPNDIPMHDWWIGVLGEWFGRTIFIKDKLISYRRHGNNASPSGKSNYSFCKKIMFRLRVLKDLIKRAYTWK